MPTAAKRNWWFKVHPRRLVTTRDVEEADIDRCIDRLTETGETFERLDRHEGGFCVKSGNDDGYRQIRFGGRDMMAVARADGHFPSTLSASSTVLEFQGGHGQPSVPWTQAHAKKLARIIAEELGLEPRRVGGA